MEQGTQNHYTDVLTNIRVRITKHTEMQQAFCSDMLSLLDSLEQICKSEEQKEGQLTKEIATLLSRYAKDPVQPQPAQGNSMVPGNA